MHSRVGLIARRHVLEGVPKVGFYEGGPRCPEDVPFASCLRALLEYLHDLPGCRHVQCSGCAGGLECTYCLIMGVSGAAFRLNWQDGWKSDNVAVARLCGDAVAPLRRALAAVGYGFEMVGNDSEPVMRRKIRASIDRGVPVMALGVVGPEWSLVCGHDEDVEVLLGWSFFQQMPEFAGEVTLETCGYFRKRNWFADTEALLILGQRSERPPWRASCLEAVAWGLKVMRTPKVAGHASGHAAYTAWADAICQDEPFAGASPARLNQLFGVHDDAVGAVAEGRWYGALYLEEMAGACPERADDLRQAAAHLKREHDLMWQAWNCVGGIGRSAQKARHFAEPDVRREIAEIIHACRTEDVAAAAVMERALRR